MKPKKLYIYNGIEGELEEISDLKTPLALKNLP